MGTCEPKLTFAKRITRDVPGPLIDIAAASQQALTGLLTPAEAKHLGINQQRTIVSLYGPPPLCT